MAKKIDFKLLSLMIQKRELDDSDNEMSLFFSDVYNNAENLYRSIYRAGYNHGVSDTLDGVKDLYERGVIEYVGYDKPNDSKQKETTEET